MENSKIYDSFQHELEDYVRKQKARGLQPEVCFRKVTEDSEYKDRGHTAPRPLMLEQGSSFTRTHTFSSSHPRQRTEENQLLPWSKLHHARQRLESLSHCQKTQDHFSKNLWLPSPPVQGKTPDLHAAQRRKDTSHLWEEDPTRAHQAGDQDQGQGRSFREEGRGECDKEEQGQGKTKHREDGDSHKENKKKVKVQPISAEKPKHRKRSHQDTITEGRRSQREKKQPGKESTQERDLWDEAILSSCY
ncbi:zinc finger matrin-type protein 1-like [Enhydra lutris kenyoni]|uniref:Zinc finger matrin-type protein 1-like n=1 Tax=Enhydra lutris kenyoni TaxID=391180 RepID=A0A2Y9JG97_ENHLU|nr:zinc finger matrin-type protein 1-like [Enhydra lutris kenyoni]